MKLDWTLREQDLSLAESTTMMDTTDNMSSKPSGVSATFGKEKRVLDLNTSRSNTKVGPGSYNISNMNDSTATTSMLRYRSWKAIS